MKTQEDILNTLKQIMSEMFDTLPDDISLQAHLKSDLDIDSIDAVDLMVRLREITGKRLNPEDFKNVHTIQDVVEIVCRINNND